MRHAATILPWIVLSPAPLPLVDLHRHQPRLRIRHAPRFRSSRLHPLTRTWSPQWSVIAASTATRYSSSSTVSSPAAVPVNGLNNGLHNNPGPNWLAHAVLRARHHSKAIVSPFNPFPLHADSVSARPLVHPTRGTVAPEFPGNANHRQGPRPRVSRDFAGPAGKQGSSSRYVHRYFEVSLTRGAAVSGADRGPMAIGANM